MAYPTFGRLSNPERGGSDSNRGGGRGTVPAIPTGLMSLAAVHIPARVEYSRSHLCIPFRPTSSGALLPDGPDDLMSW